jgi:thioredoxin 1
MADELLVLNDANFESLVLKSDKPVMVDFWATWCEPCKRIEPVIKELAGHYADRLVVGKLNVEESPVTARKYMVRSMPTFLIFKQGNVVASQMAAVPKTAMMQFIDKAI